MSPDTFAADAGAPLPHKPHGSLRILARRGGSEILLLVDQRRAIAAGEQLALVEWFDTAAAAAELGAQCARLLAAVGSSAGADRWHRFSVDHVKTLVATAKADFDTRPAARPRRPAAAWNRERVARLGFLIGQGWTAKRIAEDPMIASTPNNVYRQALRFGLSLSEAPRGRCAIQIPLASSAVYERAAARHGLTPEALMRRVLVTTAAAPQRIDEAAGPP